MRDEEVTGGSITIAQIQLVRKAMLGVPRKNAYHRAVLADCGAALDGDETCRESVARAYNKMLRGHIKGVAAPRRTR